MVCRNHQAAVLKMISPLEEFEDFGEIGEIKMLCGGTSSAQRKNMRAKFGLFLLFNPFSTFGFFAIGDDFPDISPRRQMGHIDGGDVICYFLAINKFS